MTEIQVAISKGLQMTSPSQLPTLVLVRMAWALVRMAWAEYHTASNWMTGIVGLFHQESANKGVLP